MVDSSAWLEYLADGPNAGEFAAAIETVRTLVVPTIVISEVVRRLDAQGRRAIIPDVLAQMRQATVVPLDDQLAVDAATLGRRQGLALADSIVYATTQAVGGTLWTQDEDFKTLPKVEFRAHKGR
ncbi:MAG: type II toxin-antitoxin system VapC family toxin [Gemmatimonadales bacterium]|nr:type II toxin-antitoxin system VapC family toxin [Gemmatimonadales bacterium]